MTRKALLISAVALTTVLAGGWALAQSVGHGPMGFGPPFMRGQGPDGMGPGMMKGMGPGMMHGRAGLGFADPAELETLKTELEITAAQEQAWAKYAKEVQDAAAGMKSTRESVDPETVGKMSPADRYAFVSKMREQAQVRFGAVKSAADELLATLDPSQKSKAVDILPGLAFGPGSMRGAFAGEHKH